jgi:PadR family transcriptional regulator PadR
MTLRTIALESLHGWAIAQRIHQISDDMLRARSIPRSTARTPELDHGRMGASENNRRARFYALTKTGR